MFCLHAIILRDFVSYKNHLTKATTKCSLF
nr:MAG TPA_asm: hypothetical protein [Caudoviricetes sp.]